MNKHPKHSPITTVATTPGAPETLTILLQAHGIDMQVQVSREALRGALGGSDAYWDLAAEVLQRIDPVCDAALFKFARTGRACMTLSAHELAPFLLHAGARPGAAGLLH